MSTPERYFQINNKPVLVDKTGQKPFSEYDISYRKILSAEQVQRKNWLRRYDLKPLTKLFVNGIPNEDRYILSSNTYLEPMEKALQITEDITQEAYITPEPLQSKNLPEIWKDRGLQITVKKVYDGFYIMNLINYSRKALGTYIFNVDDYDNNSLKITSNVQNYSLDRVARLITLFAPLEQAFSQTIANINKKTVIRRLETNPMSTPVYQVIGYKLGYIATGEITPNNQVVWEKVFTPHS